jgi:hypothetical protein
MPSTDQRLLLAGVSDAPSPRAMSDPDAIGPDGTVRRRRDRPVADSHGFRAGCPACARAAMVTGEATTSEVARHLRGRAPVERRIGITIASDAKPAEARDEHRPAPETRARLP